MLNLLYGGSRFATEALVNATAKLNAQVSYLHPLLQLQPCSEFNIFDDLTNKSEID